MKAGPRKLSLCYLSLEDGLGLLHLVLGPVHLDGAVSLEGDVDLGQVLRDALDAGSLLGDDVLVQLGRAVQHKIDHAVSLQVHLRGRGVRG